MSAPQWMDARNILCVRLDSMGDVLMCTPAMRALRQARPGRTLTLLSSASGTALAPYLDDVDAVITYAAPWMKTGASHGAPHPPSADSDFIGQLAERHFDAAVVFTSFSQSALPAALMCYMAGIPLRLGHCRENPYRMLSHWVLDDEPGAQIRHEVQRQRDLVASVGCRSADARMQFALRAHDLMAVRRMLEERGIRRGRPWILMHPGASAASRRYPPERWADVIGALSRRTGCPIVLTGDAHEAALIEGIRAGCGVATHSLAGQLGLGQLGAAIRLATVVVSNNTGPAHIAAALGTPLATLYALTNPQHTPWQVESRLLFHDVPCRFCYKSVCPEGHHDCLGKVAPGAVVDAVCSLMGATRHYRSSSTGPSADPHTAGPALLLGRQGEAGIGDNASGQPCRDQAHFPIGNNAAQALAQLHVLGDGHGGPVRVQHIRTCAAVNFAQHDFYLGIAHRVLTVRGKRRV